MKMLKYTPLCLALIGLSYSNLAQAQPASPDVMAIIGDVSTQDARKAFFKTVRKTPKKKECANNVWEKTGFRHGYKNNNIEKRLTKLTKTCGENFDQARYENGLKEGKRMLCGYDLGTREGKSIYSRFPGETCEIGQYPTYDVGFEIGSAYAEIYKVQKKISADLSDANTILERAITIYETGGREYQDSLAVDRQRERVQVLENELKKQAAVGGKFAKKHHIDTSGFRRYVSDTELDFDIPTSFP